MTRLTLTALVSVLMVPGVARATAGTAFSETSSTAALANAVSARPGNAGTMLQNPAGLADIAEPELILCGHVDRLDQSFARTGETAQDLGRWFGGFGMAVAAPLPGPWWLKRVRVGLALDLPAEHILEVSVPVRADQPVSPLYGSRPDRVSTLGTLAIDLARWLKIGAGVGITPSLDTPTEVTYVAGRDKSVDKSVVVRLDRSLSLAVSPFVGIRVQPVKTFGLGLVYRDASFSHATGSQQTIAGSILANDPIDFNAFWDPTELVAGAAWGPFSNVTFSTDVTWHRWSEFKTGFDSDPSPAFHDTVSVRSGIEWQARRWLFLRGGWAFEPSPIPEQTGNSNYIGSDTMVLALGGGVDLRPLVHVPLAIDLHVRTRIGTTQTSHKDPSQLPDASADLPGQQIDNLGYPSFSSQSNAYQAGLTFRFFLSKERP
jgi:long-chain fatty acid transport protein